MTQKTVIGAYSLGHGYPGTGTSPASAVPRSEAGWRWTDGAAGLRLGGARLLKVGVAMTEQYWQSPAAPHSFRRRG